MVGQFHVPAAAVRSASSGIRLASMSSQAATELGCEVRVSARSYPVRCSMEYWPESRACSTEIELVTWPRNRMPRARAAATMAS